MRSLTLRPLLFLCLVASSLIARASGSAGLLERYTACQETLASWTMKYRSSQVFHEPTDQGNSKTRHSECQMSFDGTRVSWKWYKWGGVEGTPGYLTRNKANYVSMMWDGQTYSNYRTGWRDPNGVFVVDSNSDPREVDALRYQHIAAPAFGYYFNTNDRIDQVLRNARTLAFRQATENIHHHLCHVIDAETKYGDYTIWIDPSRGYSIVRAEIAMRASLQHVYRGVPVSGDRTFCLQVLRLEKRGDTWVPVEMDWDSSNTLAGGKHTTSTHVTITELTLHPDHEAMGSFVRNDVKEGAKGWIVPNDHIKRTWHDSQFVPIFDHEIIRRIDMILETMIGDNRVQEVTPGVEAATSANPDDLPVLTTAKQDTSCELSCDQRPSEEAAQEELPSAPYRPAEERQRLVPRPRQVQPFCGLYCTYAALALMAEKVGFSKLIAPEYYGSDQGSSILELRQAVRDFGLYAEPAARLSTSGLKNCRFWAILHVRSHPESPQYDHYELFLGVKKGKARLFNPPETPRLVSFADLAVQWDGKALFISDRPIDTDVILAGDRQKLLRYGVIGVLVILLTHFARRVWLSTAPVISQRGALGLTIGQVVLLGLAAVLCGGAYHFFSDTGLLANAVATESLQKGHAMSFVPKIHAKNVENLLGTDTVFIDARLSSDYSRGHLDGAISLPIDANDAVWEQTLAKIPHGYPIVTYCQSAGCKFAEKVSLRLIEEGYSDIALFKGGWAEWVAKHGRPKPTIESRKEVEPEDADQDSPA